MKFSRVFGNDSKGQDQKSFKWVDFSRCSICPLPKRRKYNFFLHPKSLFGKVQRLFRIFLRHKYGIFAKGYQQNNTYQKCIYYQNTSEIILLKRWGRDSNPYIFAICIFESAGERMAALPPHQLFILSLIENLYFFGNGFISFIEYRSNISITSKIITILTLCCYLIKFFDARVISSDFIVFR